MRTQTPIKHKTDLIELHILSFYFHAFDFIIGIECNFAESRDTLKRGQMGPPASLQLDSAVGLELSSLSLKTESCSTDFVHLHSDFTPRCVCIDCQANLVVFS